MQPTEIVETSKAVNPLKDLLNYGQSVWLDYIRRDLIERDLVEPLFHETRKKRIDDALPQRFGGFRACAEIVGAGLVLGGSRFHISSTNMKSGRFQEGC